MTGDQEQQLPHGQQFPQQQDDKFFPALLAATKRVHAEGSNIGTESFAALLDVLVGIFDHMGAVLHIAKSELQEKAASLHRVAGELPTLRQVVDADRAAGRVTVKDSCARNLHRLIFVVMFVRGLLELFASSPTMTPRDAARKAYEQSLGLIHTYMVRTAVWASMYMLPTREHFMEAFGETEESAAAAVSQITVLSREIEGRSMALFEGVQMPAASSSYGLLTGLTGGGGGTATAPKTVTSAAAAQAGTQPTATVK